MTETIEFRLNGKSVSVQLDASKTLLWVLRAHFNLTGTKYGCGEGYCGACTVLIDGSAIRSCITNLGEVAGKSVVTIEGLADGDKLHPVQQAFVDNDALQCGYCTPGMIMNAVGLINDNPNPTHEDIIWGMENNLCRCGAHNRIIEAIETAAAGMRNKK
ncbi:(2Fe-2S)-binding protein [Maribellus sp. YY47]|uniref:(2Fe-2S)-binding protein n=1 Tax=Maribellus sp. YY47 TaxID=2929486 RepID=UPI00200124BE|nr:(2Fe-2S)-binding protein [Maribellus sp. YY47]MCK3685727.1 (2Fe-2S)-binding protein [Maribellus sp. YY47]